MPSVVDASVVANAMADDERAGDLARAALRAAGDLAAPDLIDVESVAVMRRLWLTGVLPELRFEQAIDDLARLRLLRHPTRLLTRRAYELRHDVRSYDAVYVALAEMLGWELITVDARLTAAAGPRCRFRLLQL